MIDLEEIRLGREMGQVIQAELQKGSFLPKSVLEVYTKMRVHWQRQIDSELS
jgi:hypothetical protein